MKSLIAMTPSAEPQPEKNALSLRRRLQTGGLFTLGGFGVGQSLRLLSNLILTRLLAPEAFGLMAIAVSINIWAIMLTDIGVASSVIRSRNSDDPAFAHTAWTMQIARNVLVFIVILLAALAIAMMAGAGAFRPESAYRDPLLPWIMAATGAQLLILGFASINQFTAQRRLSYGRVVGLEIATQVVTMAATITFAALGYGVWSLVIGVLAGAFVNAVASHFVFLGPSMRLYFKAEYVSEIFHFGKWLIIASFFGFLVNRGDQILFGGLMESERFGLYAVAAIWMTAAATIIQTIVNRLFYPAFSEILRDRPQDLTQAYKKARLVIDIAAIAMAFGAFFFAEFVFAILYPDAYTGVGYYLKLLSPFFLVAPFRLINTAVLAAGDSRNFTSVTVVAGVAMLLVTPTVFYMFGEKAAIVCFAAIELISVPIMWKLGAKHIKIELQTEGRMLAALLVLLALIFAAN